MHCDTDKPQMSYLVLNSNKQSTGLPRKPITEIEHFEFTNPGNVPAVCLTVALHFQNVLELEYLCFMFCIIWNYLFKKKETSLSYLVNDWQSKPLNTFDGFPYQTWSEYQRKAFYVSQVFHSQLNSGTDYMFLGMSCWCGSTHPKRTGTVVVICQQIQLSDSSQWLQQSFSESFWWVQAHFLNKYCAGKRTTSGTGASFGINKWLWWRTKLWQCTPRSL